MQAQIKDDDDDEAREDPEGRVGPEGQADHEDQEAHAGLGLEDQEGLADQEGLEGCPDLVAVGGRASFFLQRVSLLVLGWKCG
ncbi:hypothetical protein Droror1_Dr00012010 [Drosera rotundifolia]